MPSGGRYWTVLGDDFEPMPVADRYLRELRFGRDRAESTTKAYAESVALYLRWCELTGRDWTTSSKDLGLFITWLRFSSAGGTVVPGPGSRPVRSNGRINKILAATRGFLVFAVVSKEAPGWIMEQLYEVADTNDLPEAAQSESGALRHRLRARHTLHEPQVPVDRIADHETIAILKECRSARDRLIVLLLTRAGLRRGEVVGLRRRDLHLLPDNSAHSCSVSGAHLHVVRRDNVNGAWAKSRNNRAVPLDFLVVRAIDQYTVERGRQPAAADCDFLLVNLFRAPLGAPMRPDAINELFDALCRRAGLARSVRPHQGRHGFASDLADSGAMLDEIQALLGHASPSSAQPYLHPSPDRLRTAVGKMATASELVLP
nr:site-specific integrase [Nocardia cyriacigeorgica]